MNLVVVVVLIFIVMRLCILGQLSVCRAWYVRGKLRILCCAAAGQLFVDVDRNYPRAYISLYEQEQDTCP